MKPTFSSILEQTSDAILLAAHQGDLNTVVNALVFM